MASDTRFRLGVVLLGIGLATVAAGVAGVLVDSGANGPATASAEPTTSASTTTTTRPTTTTTPATTTTTTAPQETAEEFYVLFVAVLRTGDGDFLISRLHPAAIERYGEQQCRDLYAATADPTLALEILMISDPEPWRWQTSDGADQTFSDTLTVSYRSSGRNGVQDMVGHVVPDGRGRFLFLSDCGDPS